MSTTATAQKRLGVKQATRLLQLSAGYMIARPDAYADLKAKGYVEDSASFSRGNYEFDRKSGKVLPRVTWEGQQALKAYVERNGRLEVEMSTPLALYQTIIRMDPETKA